MVLKILMRGMLMHASPNWHNHEDKVPDSFNFYICFSDTSVHAFRNSSGAQYGRNSEACNSAHATQFGCFNSYACFSDLLPSTSD